MALDLIKAFKYALIFDSLQKGTFYRQLPEAVRSRHEQERLPADTNWQGDDAPLCVYVKVIYNTNFRDNCQVDAALKAMDIFKRAQEVFTTFPGLDRSINLQLVGSKTNITVHFQLYSAIQPDSLFFAKIGGFQRKQ